MVRTALTEEFHDVAVRLLALLDEYSVYQKLPQERDNNTMSTLIKFEYTAQ